MTWQTEMTPILRYLINDIDPTSYTYTDTRLQNTILISSQLLLKEVDFDKVYSVDIGNSGLTPDPTTDPRDNPFINLTCLKATVVIYGGELRLATKSSLKVVDGPSQIDTTSMYSNIGKLYTQALETYNKAKIDYVAGNSIAGQSVLTPYSFPQNTIPNNIWNYRW